MPVDIYVGGKEHGKSFLPFLIHLFPEYLFQPRCISTMPELFRTSSILWAGIRIENRFSTYCLKASSWDRRIRSNLLDSTYRRIKW